MFSLQALHVENAHNMKALFAGAFSRHVCYDAGA